MERSRIEAVISSVLAEKEAFLVDLEINEGNVINAFVDTDAGIKINELKMINRAIEGALDREQEDFALTVSSPGLDRPLKLHRQYANNVGRWVKVKANEAGTVKGQLKQVQDETITVEVPAKKKKESATMVEIPFTDIVETKIQVRF